MDEKQYLRDLAQRQAELAAHPDNAALAQAWYDHNSLRGQRPMVVFEEETCKQEFFQLQCEDPLARYVEGQLLQTIRAKELIGDDKVVPDFFRVPVQIESQFFGVERHRTVAAEGLGYHDEPVLGRICPSSVPRSSTITRPRRSGWKTSPGTSWAMCCPCGG